MAARSRNVYLLCSDAQEDTRLRDALTKHLEGPALRGATICHDGKLPFNTHRDAWRRQRLREADLVVVLLSVDLLPQLDLFEVEVLQNGRPSLPVLLRKTDLDNTCLAGRKLVCEGGGLSKLQGDAAKQEAYVEICKEVLGLLPGDDGDRGAEDQDDDDGRMDQVLRRRAPLGDPKVLACDRHSQWQALLLAAERPGHEVLLLPGGSRQGHLFFLTRARLLAGPKGNHPDPSTLGLPYYHPRPEHEAGFRGELARSLRCDEAQVVSWLRQRLQRAAVILVPELHHGGSLDDDGALVECLTRWLPRLLEEVGDVPYGLKCVQGLSYYESLALAHWVASWIGWPSRAAQRVRIESLCARIRKAAHSSVPVMVLKPLAPIRQEDILEHAAAHLRLPEAEQRRFLEMVTSDGETSEAILQMIEKHYHETFKRKDRR